MQPHGQLLCFISLHISNSSVNTSLVEYVLYSADLMSAICFLHSLLMVHRYIYSSVFLMLYQLYHSLSSSTLISSSSLYLSVATWVTPQGCNKYHFILSATKVKAAFACSKVSCCSYVRSFKSLCSDSLTRIGPALRYLSYLRKNRLSLISSCTWLLYANSVLGSRSD